jgi:hypothetical protein
MRAELLIIGAIVIAFCWLLTRGRRRPIVKLLGKPTEEIKVNVTWNGSSLDIDVNPGCAEITRGRAVLWHHDVESLRVLPKPPSPDNAPWPFRDKNPPEAGKGEPVDSGPMEDTPVMDKPSGYTLIMRVKRPSGGFEVIRLDPDIIIREDRKTEKFS